MIENALSSEWDPIINKMADLVIALRPDVAIPFVSCDADDFPGFCVVTLIIQPISKEDEHVEAEKCASTPA